MKVRILLFAAAQDIAQNSSIELDVGTDPTVSELRKLVGDTYPALRALLGSSRFAIDREFVSDDTIVSSHSEIAMIPPVSGG